MPRRRFFLLIASLYGILAVAGVVLAHRMPDMADGGVVLLAAGNALAFAGIGWMDPPPVRDGCPGCGRAPLPGIGFCAACGDARRA